jgi:hypothetical protein
MEKNHKIVPDLQGQKVTRKTLLLLILLGIIASSFMFWLTDYAIGVSPDSVMYLEAAESFSTGNGFYVNDKPMTSAPPGYSFLIAIMSFFYQGDVLLGARLLHIVIFGINTILLGITSQLTIPNSWSASGYILLGFLTSPIIVFSHAMAWSDLLFLTTHLLTYITLAWYITKPTWYSLLTISLVISAATLIRYVGVTLIPAVIVVIILFQRDSIKHKIKDITILGVISLLPLLMWMSHTIITGQSVGGREHALQFLGFHLEIPVMLAQLYAFIVPINWSVPFESSQFTIGLLIVIGIAVLLYKEGYFQQNFYSLPMMLLIAHFLFLITYLLFLIFSQLFLEVRNTWDARILIPAFISFVIIVFHLVWSLAEVSHGKSIRLAFFFIAMVSISLNMFVIISGANRIHTTGSHYTSQSWQESDIIASISTWESNVIVYSNRPDLIRFLTSKEAVMLPHHTPVGTRYRNPNYAQELEAVCQTVINGKARLVYFKENPHRWYLPTLEEVVSKCNLPVLHDLEDGIIFGQMED